MSSRASKACCGLLTEEARRDADRANHFFSARKDGWLKTIALQTSNILDSMKNRLQGPEVQVEGPLAIRACDVP